MTKHYGRESFRPLERKDEGGGGNDVVAEVKREIAAFGGDVKQLKDSLNRDLAEVRRIAEEAKGRSPEFEAKIAALTTAVGEKQAALEGAVTALKGRADQIETAMSRPGSDTGGGDKGGEELVKQAVEFYEAKAATTGNLKWRDRPTAKTVDLDGYKAWAGGGFETYLRAKDEREVDVKALSVGSNPDGGYLIPTARSARIIQKVYETSPLRQLATVETIGTAALEVPIDTGEAGAGWVGEEEARPVTSTPQIGVQRIPVHEIYANPAVTQQFLEDAAINVENWLTNKIAEKFARMEATAFISGNGIKKPRGILTYDAGSAGARGTIQQYPSGNASAVTADAIVALPFLLKAPYLANATWLMKRSAVQAAMLLKDGQGQYLWRPGLTAGVPSVLGGYPVMMADDMPAIAAGTLSIAFGDFRRAYTIVDRLGITTLRDPYTAKPFVLFYTRRRVGGDVTDFEAYVIMKIAAS
jgi:HK97 family phage major capsid protein